MVEHMSVIPIILKDASVNIMRGALYQQDPGLHLSFCSKRLLIGVLMPREESCGGKVVPEGKN